MNRQQYLDELRVRLQGLDEKEIEDALAYCNEYFEDAGEENEAEVISELGSPYKFATQVKADCEASRQQNDKHVNSHPWKSFFAIVMGLLALPFAFPIFIAIIAAILVIVMVVGSLLFGIVSIMISLLFSAVPLFLFGLSSLSTPSVALVAIGGSCIAIGITILFVLFIIFVIEKLLPALTRWLTKVYNKAKKENQNEKV